MSKPGIASPSPLDTSAMILGSSVVRHRLDDGGSALRRVFRLEDAGADEHAVGAQLHHERGVGGRGDAAGGEVDDRQAPVSWTSMTSS